MHGYTCVGNFLPSLLYCVYICIYYVFFFLCLSPSLSLYLYIYIYISHKHTCIDMCTFRVLCKTEFRVGQRVLLHRVLCYAALHRVFCYHGFRRGPLFDSIFCSTRASTVLIWLCLHLHFGEPICAHLIFNNVLSLISVLFWLCFLMRLLCESSRPHCSNVPDITTKAWLEEDFGAYCFSYYTHTHTHARKDYVEVRLKRRVVNLGGSHETVHVWDYKIGA